MDKDPKLVVSKAMPSNSFSEAKLICRVCQKQFSQYTCPRCNTRYCSLECYKRHSIRCTESFMRENVTEELHQIQSNDETKRKMLEILRRVHSEDDMDSDGEEGAIVSEETTKKVLSDLRCTEKKCEKGETSDIEKQVVVNASSHYREAASYHCCYAPSQYLPRNYREHM